MMWQVLNTGENEAAVKRRIAVVKLHLDSLGSLLGSDLPGPLDWH